MINYVLGVEWDDPFRYKLVDEKVNKNQAHSQTQGVTAYDIHYREGFRIPFSLTIVDTQGIGRDEKITQAIQEFFEHSNGIKVMTTHSNIFEFNLLFIFSINVIVNRNWTLSVLP